MSGQTQVFLQWKGTDACFDFYCECGWTGHFDGDFAYYVRCGGCQAIWQMPSDLYPVKVDPPLDTSALSIVDPEGDPDDAA